MFRSGKKAIAVLTIAAFLLNTVMPVKALAVTTDRPLPRAFDYYRDMSSDLRDGLFQLPSELGYVQDSFVGDSGKAVVHIQDAHCDYYAQRAIKKLIDHFRETYGMSLVCLEGGVGEYDLSPFTVIDEPGERTKVADFFMKQGVLSAAEFTKAEKPTEYVLWGVEEAGLYARNLKVYRENLKHKDAVDRSLKELDHIISNLKQHIYSEDLKKYDAAYSGYKARTLPLKDYLSYLLGKAGKLSLPMEGYKNLTALKEVMNEEEKINFKKANDEREKFVEAMQGKMSRNQVEEVLETTLRFKSGVMSQRDYYGWLTGEGVKCGIGIAEYPELKKYIGYISKYLAVDKTLMLKELANIENAVGNKLCADEKQARLMTLSRNLSLVQKAFNVTLPKEDFDYYVKNSASFSMNDIVAFAKREAPVYKIQAVIPQNAAEIDARLKEMEEFYALSFQRDDVFVKAVEEKMRASGLRNTVLVTGGFHTENLMGILRARGITYITVLPRFKDKEGYQSPYFGILSGKKNQFGEMVTAAMSGRALQVASIWNQLGLEVDGKAAKNAADLQVDIVRELVSSGKAVLAIEGSNLVVTFKMDKKGNVTYDVAKRAAGAGIAATVMVKDLSNMSYERHEKLIDSQLAKAYAESGRVSALEKDVLSKAAAFFRAIGHERIAQAIEKGEITINQVKDIGLFRGHASWRGVNISADMPQGEKAAVIVHEIGAYYGLSHDANGRLEELYKRFAPSQAAVSLEGEDLSVFDKLAQMKIPSGPGAAEGRDYAEGRAAVTLEELTEVFAEISLNDKFAEKLVKAIMDKQQEGEFAIEDAILLGKALVRVMRASERERRDPMDVAGWIMRKENAAVREELITKEKIYELIRNDRDIQRAISEGRETDITEGTLEAKGIKGATNVNILMFTFTDVMEMVAAQEGTDVAQEDIFGKAAEKLAERGSADITQRMVEEIVRLSESPPEVEGDEEQRGVPYAPPVEVGVDFARSERVKVEPGRLVVSVPGTAQSVAVRIISSGEKISQDALEDMTTKARNVDFVDAQALGEFLRGWEIVTLEDNSQTVGFADANNKKLYIEQSIRNAANVAPEIIPMIILSELSRSREGADALAAALGITTRAPGADNPVLIKGLNPEKLKVLGRAQMELRLEKKAVTAENIIQRIAEIQKRNAARKDKMPVKSLEPLTDPERELIARNLDKLKVDSASGIGLEAAGFGLLDQIFGGYVRTATAMATVRELAWNDQHSNENFCDTIVKMRPGVKVSFADGMAGKAREKYLSAAVMDELSPEANMRMVAYAKSRGVLAYHYGTDEHAYVFPESYTQADIERFFLDAANELLKGSDYRFYVLEGAEGQEIAQKIRETYGKSAKVITAERGDKIHIAISSNVISTIEREHPTLKGRQRKVFPFLMPAGVTAIPFKSDYDKASLVTDFRETGALFKKLLGKAEKAAGSKHRESAARNMSEDEAKQKWNTLTEGQKAALRSRAWRNMDRSERDKYGSPDKLPPDVAVKFGLGGLNSSFVEMDFSPLSTTEPVTKTVLQNDAGIKQKRGSMRDYMQKRISAVFEEAALRTGKKYAYEAGDPYTSYSAQTLESLVTELLRFPRDVAEKLKAEERVFMIRGPPIDFFAVIINKDGTVTVLNIDVLCHAENLSGEEKTKAKLALEEGLGGRKTDYVVVDPSKDPKEATDRMKKAYERYEKREITREQLREILDSEGARVFPFKALNSYVGHSVADNFILATSVSVYDALIEAAKTGDALEGKTLDAAMKNAADRINKMVDVEKFREATVDEEKAPNGKAPLRIMLEAHAATAVLAPGEAQDAAVEASAKKVLKNLEVMRSVRDPLVVVEDGRVVGDIGARVREFSADKMVAYLSEYDRQQEEGFLESEAELEEKTNFLQGIIEARQNAMQAEAGKKYVDKQYSASAGVMGNVADLTAPLVVFQQCPELSETQVTRISNEVKRELAKKYNTDQKNLMVVLYADPADLKLKIETEPAISKMLGQDRARAVVFCSKDARGASIHPRGDSRKDLLAAFKTPQGTPKAYYIEESFEGYKEGELPNPFIGPHVALAFGVREFMAAKEAGKEVSPELLQALNMLLSGMSKDVPVFEDSAAIATFLDQLLREGETLKIRKIDFETLRDQIKAEEAALISL